jgi:hypothetical protein
MDLLIGGDGAPYDVAHDLIRALEDLVHAYVSHEALHLVILKE